MRVRNQQMPVGRWRYVLKIVKKNSASAGEVDCYDISSSSESEGNIDDSSELASYKLKLKLQLSNVPLENLDLFVH